MHGSEVGSQVAVRIEGVSKRFGTKQAVDDVTLSVPRGSFTGLVGPNGAGKTTLLRALAGLHRPDRGRIDVGRMDVRRANGQIALLAQASQLDRSFPISCQDMVALGQWSRIGAFRGQSPAQREAVRDALAAVGLIDLAARAVGSLSAGQFQRALFARLMVQDAPILLLDEPFTAVDERTAEDLLGLVLAWHAAGRTVIAVLHDLHLIQRAFPDILLLAGTPIAWGATATCLTPETIRRARLGMEIWDGAREPAVLCRPAA